MSKNIILRPKTESDIDGRIERILKGLGNPEPPLRLEDVRELLKLDRHFYTADDPSILDETISRIKVATIQVYQRPVLLLEAIKNLSLHALYIPDKKRILLDSAIPEKKHRWSEAHEIGHSVIPWHEDMMLGDTAHTLSDACHDQIEAEANYAAGRLLFLREKFFEEASDLECSIGSVTQLHKRYGNTMTTTLYRFVETRGRDIPVLGMITRHPHASYKRMDTNQVDCRYFIQSSAFAKQFSKIGEIEAFNLVSSYCGSQRGGPLGAAEMLLVDDNGDKHRFSFETFYNHYDALTLAVHIGKV